MDYTVLLVQNIVWFFLALLISLKVIFDTSHDLYFSDVFVQKMHKIDESQTQTLKKTVLSMGVLDTFP